MGFLRFRRSFRVAPGLRLNLSKSGASASVGRRGAWFTVGPRGTGETIGLPGTGLSYTEQQRIGASPVDAGGPATSHPLFWLALLALAAVAMAIWL